ncbi:MAG: hypothetical protein GY782_00795 [Gammaproteobacteria bacterium]|nr:hypothetical protein [Gammaproteobacteria bacterium]
MIINPLMLPQRLHFVGIGGAGMSALAELLHHNGYTVSGSDLVMNDAVKRLRQYGVIIYDGHQACQIGGVEQIIFSTAIADNNIEIVAARQQNIPLYHRSELLAQLVQTHHGIAVIGSHALRAMESRRLWPVVRSRRRFLADRFAGTAKAPDFSLIP